MNDTLISTVLRKVDQRLLFLISLGCIVFLQQLGWKLTGNPDWRIGQQPILAVIGIVAFIDIGQRHHLVPLVRAMLYAVAALITVRVAIEVPILLAFEPREWDFLAFYMDARVAGAGLNLYNPENYATVANQLGLQVSDSFQSQLLDVGFKYPPPTAILLLPLSFGNLAEANQAWLSFVSGAAALAGLLMAVLVYKNAGRQCGLWSFADALALSGVVIYSIPFLGLGLRHGQTTGLFTCLVVITLLSGAKRWSGVSACLSMLVKPFALIPSFLLILGRYWASVTAGIVTGVILIIASIAVLGADDWASYLSLEFATAAPPSLYSEIGNKSLLAIIVRASGHTGIPWDHAGISTLYAALAISIGGLGVWMATRIARTDFKTSYCLLLMTALVIYPGTIYTYGIILSVPVMVELLHQVRANDKRATLRAALFAFVAFSLLHWNLFAANVFLWAVYLGRSWLLARAAEEESGAHAGASRGQAAVAANTNSSAVN